MPHTLGPPLVLDAGLGLAEPRLPAPGRAAARLPPFVGAVTGLSRRRPARR